MEYLNLLWLLVPVIGIANEILKWLFFPLLIALIFTAKDAHLKISRLCVFIILTFFVLLKIVIDDFYHIFGFSYALGGFLVYMVFHWVSGRINKSEKNRLANQKPHNKS